MDDFVAWLRDLMLRKNWKQKVVASQVGVSQGTVSQWLSGEDEPRPAAVQKLAELAGVDAIELFRLVYGLPKSDDKDIHLPNAEQDEVVKIFRGLTTENKALAISLLKTMKEHN
jgi:transcriptional regulator with XRE-family HTH domain